MTRTGMMSIVCVVCALALLSLAGGAHAEIVTNSSEDLRTGWYPKESAISPGVVEGGTFGKMWSVPVEGQVYAQPLLADGTLLVATENDKVYGLNPSTGVQEWSKALGTPWNAGDISCADLAPTIGVTSTPVIDTATETAYLTHKTYVTGNSGAARWYMDALDLKTGEERSGFPVEIAGKAQNAAGQTFAPTKELQRPGLLMMEGVVYVAFGSDCDSAPYQGWVFGVSTSGTVKARWVANETGNGAGIWQSGAGLTSDGPGTLLVSTGNGGAPDTPAAGATPPANLGESIVRLGVQSDGSLKATDFFAPFDAVELDSWDADFASGGITGLPSSYFGTPSFPNLAVAVGKDGYVYLLNRDDLGGFAQGPSGSDHVVQRLGAYGGVWSRPGVWPGEGGWVYIPTASGGTSPSGSSGNLMVYKYGESGSKTPQLALAATSSEAFGFSSSAPVITSDATTTGTALVWIVWSPNGSGVGAQLRAYKPQPVGKQPVQVFSAPVGTSAKFATPGVGPNKLYVGTRDGHVIAFGSPISPVLSGPATEFPDTTIGGSSEEQVTLEADDEITITEIKSSSSQFPVGAPITPALPATLKPGQKITVPVSFVPDDTGPQGGALLVTTSTEKTASFALSGSGQATGPRLETSPTVVSFNGVAVGQQATETAIIRNAGSEPMEIQAIQPPAAPFEVEGLPAAGSAIEPGHEVTITVKFAPQVEGEFHDAIVVETNGGTKEVHLTGNGGSPGELQISSEAIEYGEVAVGETITREFTVTNAGGTAVKITASKPPIGGYFAAGTSLDEGTAIQAGETVREAVSFSPQAPGPAEGVWEINSDDRSGPAGRHVIRFTGTAYPPVLLHVSNDRNQFGRVFVGQHATEAFTVSNSGEAPVEIVESNPPTGAFAAAKALPVGTIINPGEGRTVEVTFSPSTEGVARGTWQIRGSDAPEVLHEVGFEGDGLATFVPIAEQGPQIMPPPAPPAPTPSVSVSGSQSTATKSGTISLKLSCPKGETKCSGAVTLRTASKVKVGKRKEILTLAHGSFALGGGHSRTIKLRLSSAARALLGHVHTLRSSITIVARDPRGASHTTHKTITLRVYEPAKKR
jgi:hypothetical protein